MDTPRGPTQARPTRPKVVIIGGGFGRLSMMIIFI
jgi:hypothetical protein